MTQHRHRSRANAEPPVEPLQTDDLPRAPQMHPAPRRSQRSPRGFHHGLLALGLMAPLLWLMTGHLRELERHEHVAALLEVAGCAGDQGVGADAAAEPLVGALVEAERRFGVDPALLVALAVQESTCRERAVGPSGSRGLLQLSPTTARDVARRHELPWSNADRLFEAEYNVLVGAAHLSDLYREYDTWGAALSAYNLGETRYRSLSRRRGGDLTSRYARTVLERRAELERARKNTR
ncbi:MAG TPA: transglycosylase SLT domain-containing protein [Thermoanaerobaculia bacterium]|nr:transglycosylase SLT domain-containing protein [Thermoanaerobaculia bacterium]